MHLDVTNMVIGLASTRPCLLVILHLLLYTLPLAFTQPVPIDVQALTITSIASNGSCQDVYPYAWNCSLPASLVINVAGLPSTITTTTYLRFIVAALDSETFMDCSSQASKPSSFVCRFNMGGYALGMMGRPLSVLVYDFTTGNESLPFIGFSLAVFPFPTFTSISGCQGSGQGTYHCAPDHDVLTFQGSGLSFFGDLFSYQLIVGTSSGILYNGVGGTGIQVINDSCIVLPLNTSYAWILTDVQYSGVVMPLYFNLRFYSSRQRNYTNVLTQPLFISFIPLPPPIVLATEDVYFPTGCRQSPNSTGWSGCWPVVDNLAFRGHYLGGAVISLLHVGLGSWPCPVLGAASSTVVSCTLPLIPIDTSGMMWDVTVSTVTGSVTLPSLVTFSSSPSLAYLVACVETGLRVVRLSSFYIVCSAGSTLTVRGARFWSDPLLDVQLSTVGEMMVSPKQAVNVSCLQPTVVNARTITCVLPSLINSTLSSLFVGVVSYVRVLFPTTGQVTNAASGIIIAAPNSPVLTSVTGCAVSNGTLVVSGCRGGDVLTIRGSNLDAVGLSATFGPSSVSSWYVCTVLPDWTTSEMQCRLPYVDATDSSIVAGVMYTMVWVVRNPLNAQTLVGHSIQLSFTWDGVPSAPPAGDASPSTTDATAVIAGVVVTVFMIAVAGLVVWLRRRRLRVTKRRGRGSSSSWEEFDETVGSSHSNEQVGQVELA